ncbi:MAG: hypothetical protein HY509_00440, partial [Acidobacteria bacterium]|nr:hypothetical protein [Acidobacteriota bacterium]
MRRDGRTRWAVTAAAVACAGLTAVSPAELASRRYKFSPNQNLTVEIRAGGIAVRSVLFEFPGAVLGIRSAHRARVRVVNESDGKVKMGLAIALFDADDRLIGVASGGTRGVSLKPGAETDYSLPFHEVRGSLE